MVYTGNKKDCRGIQRGEQMTERIERAWSNVNSLARSSDYCNESDNADIELIESIVNKEIPRSPIRFGYWYVPDRSQVYVGWKCSNCGTKYRVYYADYDYCPHCGQRIDWEEE